MLVSIQLFARAKEQVGRDRIEIELPAGETVGGLRRRLGVEYPELQGLLERSALAVNEEFAEDAWVVPARAAVALLPPVSGGQ